MAGGSITITCWWVRIARPEHDTGGAVNSAYDRILAYVQDLHIVDTHEHLPGTEASRAQDTDVLQVCITI